MRALNRLHIPFVIASGAPLLVLLLHAAAGAQGRSSAVSLSVQSPAQLRDWGPRIDRMIRDGELRMRQRRTDALVEGREHERADQYHRGVRVFGADVARQLENGLLISLFGTLYTGIDVSTTPDVTPDGARTIVEKRSGAALGGARDPELVILPLEGGGFHLAWRLRAASGSDVRQYFIDAHDGSILLEYSDRKTQVAQSSVGNARGVLGDTKKISVTPNAAGFVASDTLRPPALRTYDMRGDWRRVIAYLNAAATLSMNDLASDSDNDWSDGAVGDAHVYAGWTYDYYFKRFNRAGLDNANIPITSLVHPVRRGDVFDLADIVPEFFINAFYAGDGVMVYGVGLPAGITLGGQTWDFLSGSLDVVAHELTHGVTEFTSNLIYLNESGALNEAFSDIMAAGAEFFLQAAGTGTLQPDYLLAEDVIRPNGLRSMANPAAFGDPDHYSLRYTGTEDNGGVHTNSGIPNHVFYLAIEGGVNRTSGRSVQGVGPANREQIEKVFYRAFTQLLPSNATFATARAATLQSARDLYGAGSPAERAVEQGWTAAGVQ